MKELSFTVRQKVLNIVDLAMRIGFGEDCVDNENPLVFTEYAPHTCCLYVRILPLGFHRGEPSISTEYHVYLDSSDCMSELSKIECILVGMLKVKESV